MRVTIMLADGAPGAQANALSFDGAGVIEAGPAGTFFKVVEQIEEEETKGGLITRVGGAKKYTWVPASKIARVVIIE